jgi:hypothetical protein
VDLHSVAASSHPSRRERESERKTTSWSRAGRPRRSGDHKDTTTVMLESQPQPTAGTPASPPAVVGLDVALLAARQLLNNCLRPECHPQRPSSGVTMSTSSSSPPSTHHTVRGSASHLRNSHAFRQRRVRHPWCRRPRCCQVRAR